MPVPDRSIRLIRPESRSVAIAVAMTLPGTVTHDNPLAVVADVGFPVHRVGPIRVPRH